MANKKTIDLSGFDKAMSSKEPDLSGFDEAIGEPDLSGFDEATKGEVSKTEAALTGAAKGLTSSFSEELGGGLQAGLDLAQSGLHKLGLAKKSPTQVAAQLAEEFKAEGLKGTPGDIGETTTADFARKAIDEENIRVKDVVGAHPGIALAGEVAGGMLAFGPLAKAATSVPKLGKLIQGLSTAKKAALTGGVGGAAYGAGMAEKIEDVPKQAAIMGTGGAVLGPAIVKAPGAVKTVFSKLENVIDKSVGAVVKTGKPVVKAIDKLAFNGRVGQATDMATEWVSKTFNDAKFRVNRIQEDIMTTTGQSVKKLGINLDSLIHKMRKSVDIDTEGLRTVNKELDSILKVASKEGLDAKEVIAASKKITMDGKLVPGAAVGENVYAHAVKIRDLMTKLGRKNYDELFLAESERRHIAKTGESYFHSQKDMLLNLEKSQLKKYGKPTGLQKILEPSSARRKQFLVDKSEAIQDDELLLRKYLREQQKLSSFKDVAIEAQRNIKRMHKLADEAGETNPELQKKYIEYADEVTDIASHALGLKSKFSKKALQDIAAEGQIQKRLSDIIGASSEQVELSHFINTLSGMPYVSYMAANPVSVAKNLAQPLLVAAPELGYKNVVQAYMQLLKGGNRDLAKKAFLKSRFIGESVEESFRKGEGVLGKGLTVYSNLGRHLLKPFGMADTVNRAVVFIAGRTKALNAMKKFGNIDKVRKALRLDKMSKGEESELVRLYKADREKFVDTYGEYLSSKFNYDYNKAMASGIQRTGLAGKLVTQFTKWPINLANMYIRDAKKGHYSQLSKRFVAHTIALDMIGEATGYDIMGTFSPLNSLGKWSTPVVDLINDSLDSAQKLKEGEGKKAFMKAVSASEPLTGLKLTKKKGLQHTIVKQFEKILKGEPKILKRRKK